MSTKYFRNFPTVNYAGFPAINILRRVELNDTVKRYWTAFYPYTTNDGERIEDVAHNYYEDVNFDWLIYHTNDIVDPYYDVPLSQYDFDEYIKKKYTSNRVAQNLILHWKNNYKNDDQLITASTYNAYTAAIKKYWQPVYSFEDNLIGYERKKQDQIISTNKIQDISFTANCTGTFVVGEWVSSDDDSSLSCQVVWANTSVVTIQHVQGDWSANNYNFTGQISGAVATCNGDTVTTTSEVIPAAEVIYFSAVNAYDWEVDQNEKKRDLQLIGKSYAADINRQIKEILE
jgi:hypothetical protein